MTLTPFSSGIVIAAVAAVIALRFAAIGTVEEARPLTGSHGVGEGVVKAAKRQGGVANGDVRVAMSGTADRVLADSIQTSVQSYALSDAGAETSAVELISIAPASVSNGAKQSASSSAASAVVPDTRKFVEKLYRDFFGQAGDPHAIEMWASLIDAGTFTAEQAVESFLDSAHQYQGIAPVARLYLATFLRAPDFDGLAHWRDAILAGRSLEEIGADFSRSPEFAQRYGALDNAAFIEQAFQNAMGREPTDAERMQWRAQLGPDPASRGRMLHALSESEEFRLSVRGEVDAVMLYAGLLGRGADSPGFSGWMGFLDQGNSRAALIRGFLASSEYRGRLLAAGTGRGS